MKNVLILCLHRPDRSPSQRFRFEQYLSFLSENGFCFTFSFLLDEEDDKSFYTEGYYINKLQILFKSIAKRTFELFNAKKFDLVFVQREAFMLGTPLFEQALGKRIPLIFDFDDSIWLESISEPNKSLSFLKNPAKTSKIIKSARLVFAGNNFLADYAKQYNSKVEVVPTTIDTAIYQRLIPAQGPICIGWSGSFTTIKDFSEAIPALQIVQEKYGEKIRFKIIGDGNFYCSELNTQGVPWRADTELEDLSEIHIGIMPLPNTEWARGKCGLKGLQYMALNIPTLMSPVGVNNEIITNGINGFLPTNNDEWVYYLSQLIENIDLQQSMGAKGRQTVVEEYSVDVWKDKYLQYFKQLVN